jgi:hypothetical protein
MKYLKLFESYEETTDSINKLVDKFESEKEKIINEYKELIDDLLLDISDDDNYKCEFRGARQVGRYDYLRKMTKEDNLLRYRISFKTEKIDDFFEKLRDVLDRIIDSDIDYTIDSVNTVFNVGDRTLSGHISEKPKSEMHPQCLFTSKSLINNEILKNPTELQKCCLYISF